MIYQDEYGRCYTTYISVANKYRLWYEGNYFNYSRWVNFYIKTSNGFLLPGSAYKQPRPTLQPFEEDGLYDWQKEAVKYLQNVETKGCLIQANEGVGKSRFMKACYQAHGGNAVFVVPTNSIKRQIQEEIKGSEVYTMFGFSKNYDKINDGRLLIMDEVHHLSNKKIKECLYRKGRIVGCTATPSRQNFDIKGFEIILGSKYVANMEALPVEVYCTKHYTFYELEVASQMLIGYAPESSERWRILSYNDNSRNVKINDIAKRLFNAYKKVIVFTDRVYHAEILKHLFSEWCDNLFCVYDNNTIKDELANLHSFLILCTRHAAGEGFNVPDLRAGLLTCNTQEMRVLRQMVGRIRRFAKDKEKGVFVDIHDVIQIGNAKKKYLAGSQRMRHYRELGFKIISF